MSAEPANDTASKAAMASGVSREAFIAGMRPLANSVSVVTTHGAAGQHGGTVSAFCSVSADPPTFLVCLKSDSRIARLVTANGVLALNVLGAHQADLAKRFAGGDDSALALVQRCEDGICDRFDGIALEPGCEQPVLSGALAFYGRVSQAHTAGSHTVVIAQVDGIVHQDHAPLVYRDGAYCRAVPLDEGKSHG